MIRKALLKDLQQIIKEEYGVALKFEDVSDIGHSLVGFFELLIELNNQTL